eukprot:1007079-Prymnesium_polylepis.1
MSTDSFPGHDFSATMCMDGVTGNTDGLWNFCMTPAPGWSALQEPWLSLRLEASATVGHVVIHGREDCCQRHLSPFEVWVGDKEGATEGAARCGGDGPEGARLLVRTRARRVREARSHGVRCMWVGRGKV